MKRAGLAGIALIVVVAAWFAPAQFHRRAVVADLTAEDPGIRRAAAWEVAERPFPAGLAAVRRALDGPERDAAAREALVYALGRSGQPEDAARLARIATGADGGYVRQAAWLALSRVSPEEARRAARAASPMDAWDRLGRSQALLLLGEVDGVDALLRLAVEGDADQRVVAARALTKGLRPLLDAAGRWPLDVAG